MGLRVFWLWCKLAMCFGFILLCRGFQFCENYCVSGFVCAITCVFIARLLYQL